MNQREAAIAKIQHLPEPLLEEVSDFIDFVAAKHAVPVEPVISIDLAARWAAWLQDINSLKAKPSPPTTGYQHCLVDKYRQQWLEL